MSEYESKVDVIKEFLLRFTIPVGEVDGIPAEQLAKHLADKIEQVEREFEWAK